MNANKKSRFELNIGWERVILFIIFLMGIFSRLFLLGRIPCGLHQDEAYAGYEAYALLNYGHDSWGYVFPVYLTTWGSGMSVMNAALMIPFFKLFGVSQVTLRLPQALLGVLSLYVFYRLMKLIFKKDSVLPTLATFLLAINPWHILMCRWGLDCNMSAAFCLIAFYYFCKGCENSKWYPISALFYGLTLYCYAISWLMVPAFLLMQGVYLIWTKKFKYDRYIIISVIILAVMAIPLFLFILVNSGKIDEIVLPFMSIPRMPVYRASEIDFGNQIYRFVTFIKSLIRQNDGLIWDYAGPYGLFYNWGFPVLIFGFITLMIKGIKSIIKREFHPDVMILWQVCFCVLFSSMLDADFSKMTLTFIPMIALISMGLRVVFGMFKNLKVRAVIVAICGLLGLISFASFENYYFGDYQVQVSANFKTGLRQNVEFAESIRGDGIIYLQDYASHPCVLFYSGVSADDEMLIRSREEGIEMSRFSYFSTLIDDSQAGDVCILMANDTPEWLTEDRVLFSSGEYLVARR